VAVIATRVTTPYHEKLLVLQSSGIEEVSADKAYLSRKNLNAVEAVGAMPFIPFKSNTIEPTGAGMWARMYHLFMYQREAYMEHYHKRSNIETAYSMIKGKFGSALRSKSDCGQINEALCKVLAHNICVLVQAMHTFNIHPIFGAETQPEPKMAVRGDF
jgi:transposase